MKRTIQRLLMASLLLPAALAAAANAPVVNNGGIVNAASYAADGLPYSGIAPGSQFAVFGGNLGAAGLHSATTFPLPQSLQGTSIRVAVKGVTVNAIMLYTTPAQVGAILPSSTPVGDGTLTLTYNGVDSAPVAIHVKPAQFGIFTRNSGGSGPAIVQNVNSATDEPLNSLTQSLQPGQLAILWGTGLGAVAGNEAAAPLPGDLKADVTVLVGGQQAPVSYRGRSGCCAGVDEIIFQVPQGITGCYVPLAVMTGTAVSNFSSISIAPNGGTCSDPYLFSAADLQDLAKGNDLRIGSVELFRAILTLRGPGLTASVTQDVGAAGFYRFPPVQADAAPGLLGVLVRGFSGLPPLGSCNLYPPTALAGLFGVNADTTQPATLDAGAAVNVSGAGGGRPLTKSGPGVFNGQLGGAGVLDFAGQGGSPSPPYLDPGTFTVDNGTGGADVGPFHASITVPDAIGWSNAAQISTIDRTKPLAVTWTGGDPTKEFVVIAGLSTAGEADNSAALFVCTGRADAHTFTVPPYILSAMPAGQGVTDSSFSFNGLLWIGNVSMLGRNRIAATGLSTGFLYYLLFQFQTVTFQ